MSKIFVNFVNGYIVVFDDVIINVGYVYSFVIGVFWVFVDGNYMFLMIGIVKFEFGDYLFYFLLKRNGNIIGYIFLDLNYDYYFKRIEVIVVFLILGDEVFV